MNFLDFIFPKKCVGCQKIGNYFCSQCQKKITQTDLVCPMCDKFSVEGMTHSVCKKTNGLDGLWSLGDYQDPLKKAIQKLKYKWIKELAEVLIEITLENWTKYQPLLLKEIKKDQGKGWVIIPVPLHISRQNLRGFNQSALLAKALAKKMGLQYQESLKRIKKTKPQVNLKGSDRRENIKGAFTLTHHSSPISPNIILVDDVWTTGSTLKECGEVLKKAGVKTVWGLTVAR